MAPSGDELAGIVDLFGALTRDQLRRAVREAAFRAGDDVDGEAVAAAIDGAVDEYRLVTHEVDGERLLVAGPTAFPTLPEGAEDLPHIMDVAERSPDRAAVGESVARRFRAETARAVDRGDVEAIERLLDASYDLETWAPVELSGMRDRLDDALAGAE
jgi:hypothetical protein